ncbi:MAG TPA: hypothetical protein EYQ21_04550 [Flavobacteriales bacterium]|nr:hypothetical protein [Flavobacteriales bacterium]
MKNLAAFFRRIIMNRKYRKSHIWNLRDENLIEFIIKHRWIQGDGYWVKQIRDETYMMVIIGQHKDTLHWKCLFSTKENYIAGYNGEL